VVLLALLGVALLLAAFRVDTSMLSGGNPETWNGWVHGIAFLLIIATGVLAPLTMALAVRGDPSWRPIAVVSLAATALLVVFLFLPWGNASFLMAILTVFA
jgi:predicted membrane channel-forming protein YqfA (hemolysin III family)